MARARHVSNPVEAFTNLHAQWLDSLGHLFRRSLELADGFLDLISDIGLEILHVTHEKFLQAAQKIRLLRLANYAYELELERALGYLMKLGQCSFNCELEDRKVNVPPDLRHCIELLQH